MEPQVSSCKQSGFLDFSDIDHLYCSSSNKSLPPEMAPRADSISSVTTSASKFAVVKLFGFSALMDAARTLLGDS